MVEGSQGSFLALILGERVETLNTFKNIFIHIFLVFSQGFRIRDTGKNKHFIELGVIHI